MSEDPPDQGIWDAAPLFGGITALIGMTGALAIYYQPESLQVPFWLVMIACRLDCCDRSGSVWDNSAGAHWLANGLCQSWVSIHRYSFPFRLRRSVLYGDPMMRTLAITLLLVASPSLASDVVDTIPERFQGEWAGSVVECGALGNDSTLRLESDGISYWESFGVVKAVVARGSDEIALIAEFSGEGESWLGTLQVRLSPDGNSLIDEHTVPGEEVVRFRCP